MGHIFPSRLTVAQVPNNMTEITIMTRNIVMAFLG